MTRLDVRTWGLPVAALMLGLMAGATPASAQDTSGVFMKDVLGKLGIIDEERPPIEYRERAPLVIPPGAGNLPPPRAAANARDGNWPNDPDVAAARRAQREARQPVPVRNDSYDGRALSVDQIRAGRRAGSGAYAPGERARSCMGDNCRDELLVNPDVLRNNGHPMEQKSNLAYGQEPGRGSLAEPPKGYRIPSANAPLGDGKASPIVRESPGDVEREFIRQQAGSR
ncbi:MULTISPECIES: hypothetical protein [unclassified Chelatococcus]|uniref:hypothetical protein n=1 Tax=unclassified Chelatococcus TaxID=2638111 RepID=UPI001BD16C43|nr:MULTISPECIES: hypothetical protein [unclassified Chelatococcus]MBS7695836.1 hypothetical protein [Chelatococcus sp. YT9]MBX3555789.1 hypothetical protein [Chelatococcus sp.]